MCNFANEIIIASDYDNINITHIRLIDTSKSEKSVGSNGWCHGCSCKEEKDRDAEGNEVKITNNFC